MPIPIIQWVVMSYVFDTQTFAEADLRAAIGDMLGYRRVPPRDGLASRWHPRFATGPIISWCCSRAGLRKVSAPVILSLRSITRHQSIP